jgi:hypothetical protein
MSETPLSHLPHRLDDELSGVLVAIGLVPAETIRTAKTKNISLAASGVTVTTAEVDAALDKTELSVSDRFAVKVALANQRLLRHAA